MEDHDVHAEIRGECLLVRLDRPAQRNALRHRTWQELEEILDRAEVDNAVAVLVLTGGDDWFCAGADLRENAGRDHAMDLWSSTTRLRRAQRALHRLRTFPKATVAAVEGYAIGLGWCLALACDLIVAAEDAYFAPPSATAGMLADGGLIRDLTEAVGRRRTNEILLLHSRLPAPQAAADGLVTTLAPRGEATARAVDLAADIAARPSSVHFVNKALLASALGPDGYFDHEATAVALNRMQPANLAGREAFLGGRRFYAEQSR